MAFGWAGPGTGQGRSLARRPWRQGRRSARCAAGRRARPVTLHPPHAHPNPGIRSVLSYHRSFAIERASGRASPPLAPCYPRGACANPARGVPRRKGTIPPCPAESPARRSSRCDCASTGAGDTPSSPDPKGRSRGLRAPRLRSPAYGHRRPRHQPFRQRRRETALAEQAKLERLRRNAGMRGTANSSAAIAADCIQSPNLSGMNRWPEGNIALGREWKFKEIQDQWRGTLRWFFPNLSL